MKIYNWDKFNELKTSTYFNAAHKLKKLGHKERSEKISRHSTEMGRRYAEKFNIGTCTFIGGITGEFCGFDFGMTRDMFIDNEKEFLSIPLFFLIDINGVKESINAFTIEYQTSEDYIDFVSCEMDQLQELKLIGPKEVALMFNNRKDANKVIMALKSIKLEDELSHVNGQLGESDMEDLQEHYNNMLTKLRANEMFKS